VRFLLGRFQYFYALFNRYVHLLSLKEVAQRLAFTLSLTYGACHWHAPYDSGLRSIACPDSTMP
jgi:hypothetical protein